MAILMGRPYDDETSARFGTVFKLDMGLIQQVLLRSQPARHPTRPVSLFGWFITLFCTARASTRLMSL